MAKSASDGSYRVLLTNFRLDVRGGTTCATRDLALGLLRRGHRPIVYSPVLGAVSQDVHARGIPVIDDLRLLAEPPDLIHGHHYIPTAEAIIHFPRTPAIFVCHAWQHWLERPPKFPQVLRYGAVSEAVRDRLVHTEGIDPATVFLHLNAVDLDRVPARTRPLAPVPKRAICFTKDRSHVPILRAACEGLGIEFATLGGCADRLVAHPEKELVEYDIVFATGRSAIEALCCGAAVVVCDANGLGGFVTSESYAKFRKLNFALRSLTKQNSVETVLAVLKTYDAEDAAKTAERARSEVSLETRLDNLLDLYRDVVAAWSEDVADRAQVDYHSALRGFLHEALPRKFRDSRWPWQVERNELMQDKDRLDKKYAMARQRLIAAEAEIERLRHSRSWRLTAPLRWLKRTVLPQSNAGVTAHPD